MALLIVFLPSEPEFFRFMDLETFCIPDPSRELAHLVNLLDGKSERAVRASTDLRSVHVDLLDLLASLVESGEASRSLTTPVPLPWPVTRVATIVGPDF